MEDKQPTIFRKFYEELKSGNPMVILLLMAFLVALGSLWVWQVTHSVKTTTPTPRFTHPGAISPIEFMTARALSAVPPAPSPTPLSTPNAAIFRKEKQIAVQRLKYQRSFSLVGTPFFFGR